MRPLALCAVTGALVALAACSHPAATATGVKHVTVTHSAVLVNCPQEYDAWKHGPANFLLSELNTLDSASTTQDMPALTAALKKVRPAVLGAVRYPIPACADPKGYWTALLMHVNAAAANVGSASGAASIKKALKGMSAIEHELRTELKSTAGVK